MEWTIYSIGSAVYLEEILNAVAMISGTGDIEGLAKIGLLIGTFILAFQAVFNGTGIQFQKLLVCFILYLAMYGPTGTALIEDVYTKDVAVVDNVPLGPLAVGSILSNVGYRITELFETAFSTPAMTSYGFADPLTALIKVRKAAYNVISLPSFTGGGGNASLLSSWSNYIKECTLVAANNDERTLIKMLSDPSAIGALRFDSNVYYTKIFDGSANGQTVTCTVAFETLSTMTTSSSDALLDDLSTKFATASSKPTGVDIEARVNDALINIAGGVVDARNFAVMSAILPILEGAPGERAVTDMQGAAAIMMNQAIQQQNTQWAAEGSMFTKYIRPFMTFFEGFIYAITPLMAFVIVLGGFGIGLVSKYLLILIWMTLWMPVLAIVNLYTLSTTKAKLEALTGSTGFGTDGLSFNTLRDMLPVVEAQLGVAGMMASSVPALCMFLVYGTSVAASGIASRLNGSDTINEKISSPDVVQPGPGLSMTSQASHDPTRGARTTGSEELRPTINTGAQLEKAVQSSQENLKASSVSYNQAFQKQVGQAISNGSSLSQTAEMGSNISNALGLNKSSDFNSAAQAAYAQGATEQDVNAFVAQTTAGTEASLGFSLAGNGAGAKVGASVSGSSQQAGSSNVSRSQQEQIAASLKSAVQNQFTAQNATGTAEKLSSSQEFKNNASFTDSLGQQTADLQQSKEAYSQTQAFKDSYGMQTSTSIDALAQDAMRRGTAGDLVSGLDKIDGPKRDEAMSRFESFKAANGTLMGNEASTVGAAIYALASTGNYAQLGASLGINTPDVDANSNSGIAQVGNNGNEAAYNQRDVPSPTFNPATERQRIEASGNQSVNSAHESGGSQVDSNFKGGAGYLADYKANEARTQLDQAGQNLTFSSLMSNSDNATATVAAKSYYNSHSSEVQDQAYRDRRVEALDQGLPEPLANVAALAQTGQFSEEHMQNAVVDLQKDYGLSNTEAMGAVGAAVTGSLSNNQNGGSHYANIQAIYSGDSMQDALMEGHNTTQSQMQAPSQDFPELHSNANSNSNTGQFSQPHMQDSVVALQNDSGLLNTESTVQSGNSNLQGHPSSSR